MSSSLVLRSLRGSKLRASRTFQIPWLTRSFSDPNPRPEPPPPINPTTRVTNTLYSYSNNWQKALEFFNWVESPEFTHTTQTYNAMLQILGKYLEFELSWNLINRMSKSPNSPPNHSTFRIVFNRYLEAHMVTQALETYNKLEGFGLKDEISFFDLIQALCDHGHVVEAYDLCFCNETSLDSISPKQRTKLCNLILKGYSKIEWFSKCCSFWDEIDERGFEKNLQSFTIFMEIHCKAGKPWLALEIYREITEKGFKLDAVAYNAVIHAAGLTEGVDFCYRVMDEMRENGIEPNSASYNAVIKLLFCEDGEPRFGDAYKVLDEMRLKNLEPDSVTYHCFFKAMRNVKEIMELFDEMVRNEVRPGVETFVLLLRKFGRWGYLRPMLLVWKGMIKLGVSPDEHAYNALLDALIHKNWMSMAKKFYEEMLARGLSARPRPELSEK